MAKKDTTRLDVTTELNRCKTELDTIGLDKDRIGRNRKQNRIR